MRTFIAILAFVMMSQANAQPQQEVETVPAQTAPVYVQPKVQARTVIYDERESYTCAVDRGVDIQGLHFRRVKLPRGIDGTHIQVVIENQDGADFDLQSLRIIAIPKTRRM